VRRIVFPVVALFAVTLLAMPSIAVAHGNGMSHKHKGVEVSPIVIPHPQQATIKQSRS